MREIIALAIQMRGKIPADKTTEVVRLARSIYARKRVAVMFDAMYDAMQEYERQYK